MPRHPNAYHLDANECLALFKRQDGVEKRIRAVEVPPLIHPPFVHTAQRLEGLVFISLFVDARSGVPLVS